MVAGTKHWHYMDVCVCGKVLKQCRCPGPKKTNITTPCTHVTVEPDMSDDDILAIFDGGFEYDPYTAEYDVPSESSYDKTYKCTFTRGQPPTCTCVAFAIGRNRAKSNKPVKTHGPQEAWCKHLAYVYDMCGKFDPVSGEGRDEYARRTK